MLLVVLAMLPAVALILYNARVEAAMQVEESRAYASHLSVILGGTYRSQIEGVHQLLVSVSGLDAVLEQDPAACSHLFGDLIQQDAFYANLFGLRANGEVFCSAMPSRGLPVAAGNWFSQAADARDFTVAGYAVEPSSNRPVLLLAYPTYASNRLQTMLVAVLNLEALETTPVSATLPGRWALALLDSDSTVLAGWPGGAGWIGSTMPLDPPLQGGLQAGSAATFVSQAPDGIARLYSVTPVTTHVPSGNLYALVGLPRDVADAAAADSLEQNLMLVGLVAILALAATWVAGDVFVLRQVRALSGAVDRLAAGDLNARAQVPGGAREVRAVGDAFDNMASALQLRAQEQEQSQALLREVVSNLDQARADLEERVEQRTAELVQANATLEGEVARQQQTEARLRRRSQELAALYGVTAVASVQDPETLLQQVLELVLPVVGSSTGWVTLPGAAPAEPQRIVASAGLPAAFLDFEGTVPLATCPMCADMLKDKADVSAAQPVVACSLLSARPVEPALPENHVSVALRAGDRLLGLLNIAWDGVPDLSAEDRTMLSTIGRQVGIALENARLFQEVRDQFQQLQRSQMQLIRTEKLAVMGRLAASFAHEINNPLQAIRSNLELSLDYPLSAEERMQYVQIARQEIERLSDVTLRTLGFLRPSSSGRSVVCVADLVEQTMALVERHVQRAGIQVTLNMTGRAQVLASGDQLVQVFLNLVMNAVEAMGQSGNIEISERLEGDEVCLDVVDDGPPIPEDHMELLFEPFFTTKASGTGLGLPISRGLVEQYGGSLTAANLDGGRGVIFTVTLPIVQVKETASADEGATE